MAHRGHCHPSHELRIHQRDEESHLLHVQDLLSFDFEYLLSRRGYYWQVRYVTTWINTQYCIGRASRDAGLRLLSITRVCSFINEPNRSLTAHSLASCPLYFFARENIPQFGPVIFTGTCPMIEVETRNCCVSQCKTPSNALFVYVL
jgi:hypothetical protein